MKRILITGANSYVGTSFKRWVAQYPDKYSVDAISVRDDKWKSISFNKYDVILHTAAIVHVKEKDKTKYFNVNRDLTVEIAKKAKLEGVKQFIFLSTMGVYGIETGIITKETVPKPKTAYARSKYEAEQLLLEMNSNRFNITILRPPIVYGKNCPGNYARLANLAIKLPIFPDIRNQRSMIFIDNLSESIRILIDTNQAGVYFPQNKDYVNTTELVRLIAKTHGKKIKILKVFNWVVGVGLKISGTFRKVFGTFIYDKRLSCELIYLSHGKGIYGTVSFEESIIAAEKNIGDLNYEGKNK